MSSQEKNKAKKASDSTATLKEKLHFNDESENQSDDVEVESQKIPYQELLAKYEEADEKSKQYWDKLLRMQAEQENTSRRVERDIANAHKYALEKFVLELLPIVDNMERSLSAATEENSPIYEGVNLTLKMFRTALEKFGVEQINPQDEAFNPELHQAVSVQPDPNVKPGTVISVLQKGYLLNNRLIRAALVVVAKAVE